MLPPRQDAAQIGYGTSGRRKGDIDSLSLSQGNTSHQADHEYFSVQEKPPSPSYLSDAGSINSFSGSQIETNAALTALQYLPIPLLVLSSQKTVVLANDAFGRLLEIDLTTLSEDGTTILSVSDILRGQTMGQMGIDVLKDGSPVWVSWDDFLDGIVEQMTKVVKAKQDVERFDSASSDENDLTPIPTPDGHHLNPKIKDPERERPRAGNLARTTVHDVAVDVVITWRGNERSKVDKDGNLLSPNNIIQANLIISLWAIEEERYFTMTFTSATPSAQQSALQSSSRTVGTTNVNLSKARSAGSSTSSKSHNGSTPTSVISSPAFHTPTFPPLGPPSRTDKLAVPSLFQKTTQLKDAILNSINMPAYAMWKDESFGIPNRALLKLMPPPQNGSFIETNDQRDFLSQFQLWSDDFKRELAVDEFPIVELCRTQKRMESQQLGIKHPLTGSRLTFEVVGEPILDDTTGDFLGGLVTFKDITEYTKRIASQIRENKQQFEYIANLIPHMVWTTNPEGKHDWYSKRWYDYTGMTVEESLGEGWRRPFNEEDMPATTKRWAHSLATGNEYLTEYRCLRHDGEWRWMLGRAVPFRDEDGKIVKWFGTCTDIQDLVETRQEARQTRERLLRVIEIARVSLWAVSRERKLVLLEGCLPWMVDSGIKEKSEVIGQDFYPILDTCSENARVRIRQGIEKIFSTGSGGEIVEMHVQDRSRWFRTRLLPFFNRTRKGGIEGDSYLDGVIGVSMDVTEARESGNALAKQEHENARLLANAVAAKEASRMKSQFLANMSHEIRTPIAGVIGMSELLLDMDLSEEQREYAENIQRSANGLLTVINDILDFSKVESGRLDVEEVQFSLSVVIRDVNKMMSFAALRRNIAYHSAIQPEIERDLKVMGDPGRLRQIMTNLLTNSIKFTSEGHVSLNVSITEETEETINVKFVVEDTGIGIEEDVRKKLFKPFSQADSSTARRFGGTGLGLTISKNLVELMHGQIELESRLGQGTKASFWVPLNKAPYQTDGSPLVNLGSIPDRLQSDISVSVSSSEDHGTPPQTPTILSSRGSLHGRNGSLPYAAGPTGSAEKVLNLPESERRKVHVLVVEDNQINQQIALKTIKKLNFSVDAVWDGKQALEYLLEPETPDHPLPNIILMDVQMPIMDGYRATHTIRTTAPFKDIPRIRNIPILAMTASAIQGDKEKCQEAGMDDYLAKPVKGKVLEKMLVKWALAKNLRTDKSKSLLGARSDGGGLSLGISPAQEGEMTSSQSNQTAPSRPSITSRIQTALEIQRLQEDMGRLEYQNTATLEKSLESNVDRAMKVEKAEEMASSLRDDKLLSVSAGPPPCRSTSDIAIESARRKGSASHALTRENISRLSQQDGLGLRDGHSMAGSTDSMQNNPHSSENGGKTDAARKSTLSRPPLSVTGLKSLSESTVTPRLAKMNAANTDS